MDFTFYYQIGAAVFGVLFAVSELLSFIPQIKANGVFQAIYNILHRGK